MPWIAILLQTCCSNHALGTENLGTCGSVPLEPFVHVVGPFMGEGRVPLQWPFAREYLGLGEGSVPSDYFAPVGGPQKRTPVPT